MFHTKTTLLVALVAFINVGWCTSKPVPVKTPRKSPVKVVSPVKVPVKVPVNKPTKGKISFTMNKASYRQGEILQTTIDITNDKLRYYDFIKIVAANVTKDYYSADNFYFETEFIGPVLNDDGVPMVHSFRLNCNVGKYKAVLFKQSAEDDIGVLAISNVFEVKKNTVIVATKKSKYRKNEDIVITYNSTRSVPFQYYDFVHIVPASVNDNLPDLDEYVQYSLRAGGSSSFGTMKIPFDPERVIGRYKVVLFMAYGEVALDVSNVFEIV